MADDMVASLTLRLQNQLSGGLDEIKQQFTGLSGTLDALNATMRELRDVMAGMRGPVQLNDDLKAVQETAAKAGAAMAVSVTEIGTGVDADLQKVRELYTALGETPAFIPPGVVPGGTGGGEPAPAPGEAPDEPGERPFPEPGAAPRQKHPEASGGGDMITDALALAFGYDSFKAFANFDQAAKQIAIVEGLNGQAALAEDARLKKMTDTLALKYGNSSMDLMDAYSFLVTDSIPRKIVDQIMGPLAEASTAYNVPVSEMSQAVFTLYKNLGIGPGQMGTGLSVLHHAAMIGHFGMEDFSMFLPEIGGQMQLMGMSGLQGEITGAAALEILRRNTGTAGEAATNLQDLLFYLHSPMGLRMFDKSTRMVDLLGPSGKALLEKYHVPSLDLPKYLNAERAAGIDPINAMADYFSTILKNVNSPTDRADIVGSFIHNQAAQNAILALVQYHDDFDKMQQKLSGVDDSTVMQDFKTSVSGTSADLKLFDENLAQANRDIGGLWDYLIAEPFSHFFSPGLLMPGGYGPSAAPQDKPAPAPVIHLRVNVDRQGNVTAKTAPNPGTVLGRH